MKKLGYMGIGALFILVVSFAWFTFADQTTTPAPSAAESTAATGTLLSKVEGTLTSLDPQTHTIGVWEAGANVRRELALAPDTTVYRNGQITDFSALRVGDQISAFVHTEQGAWRVRYVVAKGSEPQAVAPPASDTAGSDALTSPTPTAAPAAPPVTATGKPLAVKELKLKVKLANNEKYELKFKQDGHESPKIRPFVEKLGLSPTMGKDEIAAHVLRTLGIAEHETREVEVDVTFVNGKKVELKLKPGHGHGKKKGQKKRDHADKDNEADDAA